MKTTNNFNLPATIFNAVSEERELKPNRLSVTDLINPPLIRQLKIKHWDEIEEDASDKLWLLLGKAVHSVLEAGAIRNSLPEQKIEVEIGGFTVVGVPDLWDKEVISDYKITSVYSFLLGDKPEWEAQLNIYAFLFDYCGFVVNRLEINAILRDWQKSKVKDDYPAIPFQQVNIPLWNKEKIEKYIKERVELHSQEGTECSPMEKWERPTTYRVMKKNRKTAVRVFEDQQQADDLIKTDKDYYLEIRKGSCVRCESYCLVRNYCPYRKPTKEG